MATETLDIGLHWWSRLLYYAPSHESHGRCTWLFHILSDIARLEPYAGLESQPFGFQKSSEYGGSRNPEVLCIEIWAS